MTMDIHGYTAGGAIDATIEGQRLTVPDEMGNRHRRMIAEWEADGNTIPPYVPPAPTAAEVKAEAMRRILLICPEWKQRNLIAEASILAEKGRGNWTSEELATWDAGELIWSDISAIRSASNVIEVMDPIPVDYTSDYYWGN